jgi:hypothetical protein
MKKTKALAVQVFRSAHEWAVQTGAAGGKAAAQKMTPQKRKTRAKKAARASVKVRRAKARARRAQGA